jgi:hypothetical protein
MRLAFPFALLALLVAACGGNVVVDGAGAGGAMTTTTTSTGGSGGGDCIAPTVAEACSAGDVACQPANPCCTGYEWVCMGGSWQQSGLGCACMTPVPFACGQMTCTGSDFCMDSPPGIEGPDGGVPPDSFTCAPLPAACAATPTCACIGEAMGPGDPCSPAFGAMCTVDAEGSVTIVCVDA